MGGGVLQSMAQNAEKIATLARPDSAALRDEAGAAAHGFLAPVLLPYRLPTSMYGAMLAIWHIRPILQRRFPLHRGRQRDFIRYLAWCAADGRRQYAILRAIPAWDAELARPMALPALESDRWSNGYSVAMFLFGVARSQYSFGAMLGNAATRHRMASAYWRGERHKRRLPPPAEWQNDFLARRFKTVEALLDVIRHKKNDAGKPHLQLIGEYGLTEFPASVGSAVEGRPGALRRISAASDRVRLPAGIRRSPVRLPTEVIRPVSWLMEQLSPQPTESQLSGITCRIPEQPRQQPRLGHPFGVNLFGYARGELGIGEDVRLLALALKTQNIPFCIINVQPGADVSQQDRTAEEWIASEPRYAINIFCTTGIEQVRYACEHGLDALRGRYNIGFWPWELPLWPVSCSHAFSLVDEIWGISRFTAHAYRNARRPVYAMPMSVTVDAVAADTRADFGLPEKDYLFVFSFDLNSTLTRKNPAGLVRAFQRAFPRGGGEAVGLVIKASHASEKNRQWLKLKAEIEADPRIHLIDETLRRPQVLALYRCCNCYVSLHRAEGFGRGLAEALLLDLQLIATDFSGNLDFCTEERVGLVRYEKRDLQPGEYFHAEGQYWAEPDLDHAAKLMREIYARPRKVRTGEFDFSPARAGIQYAKRLYEIKQTYKLARAIEC